MVNSFDQLINMSMQMQMSQLILTPGRVPVSSGPYLMVPQAAAAAASSPVPAFPPAPGFIAYHQNPLMVAPPVPSFAPHQAFSQPPSEPVDEVPSSASNTPDDSDAGWNMNTIQNAVGFLILLMLKLVYFTSMSNFTFYRLEVLKLFRFGLIKFRFVIMYVLVSKIIIVLFFFCFVQSLLVQTLLPLQEKSTDTYDASWNLARDVGTDPEHSECCDASTQTNPGRVCFLISLFSCFHTIPIWLPYLFKYIWK